MTEIEQARKEDAQEAINVLDQTTCLLLRFHRCGIVRKGNLSKIQTEANKSRLGLNKKILQSESYDHMMLISRDCRRYTKQRHVPGSPFAEGTHLIPLGLVEDINEKITNAENAFKDFADTFVNEYANLVEEAKAELADQFDSSNYFDVSTPEGRAALRSKFWVERRWFDWSPSSESKVGKAIAFQESQRQGKEVQDLALQVKAALRVGFKKLIDHLVDRLTPTPNGSRKQFAPTTVTKVVDFLALFSARNVVGDRELAVLADQAKAVLDGQTPESIRSDENVASVMAEKMITIKSELDKLVEEMPERVITLDDEDDD